MNVSFEVAEEAVDYFAAQDSFDFSSIPLYMMDAIMEKFTFKQFSSFEGTCQLAQNLSTRNHRLQFPVETKKVIVSSNYVYFNDGKNNLHLSFEECSRMKFPPVEVIAADFNLTRKTCDFLLKLEITTFKCFFPEYPDFHVNEFFKNAKIQSLKMSTTRINDVIEQFYYDTTNIDEVEVDNCMYLSPVAVQSLKARRRLSLSDVFVFAHDFMQYFEKVKNGKEEVIDMTFHKVFVYPDEDKEIMRFIVENCTEEDDHCWVLKDNDGEKTIMRIEVDECGIKFRRC